MTKVAIFLFLINSLALTLGSVCPGGLDCGYDECCVTEDNAQYCCGGRREVYVPSGGYWLRQHWGGLIAGLIISIIISVVLSLLCCLFCNGCWWHRRRNPSMYGDFPFGTITISHHPPPYFQDSPPSSRAPSSILSTSRPRVHFDQQTNIKEYEASDNRR